MFFKNVSRYSAGQGLKEKDPDCEHNQGGMHDLLELENFLSVSVFKNEPS